MFPVSASLAVPSVAIASMKRISIAISDKLHRDLKTLAVYQDETLVCYTNNLLIAKFKYCTPLVLCIRIRLAWYQYFWLVF